MGPTIESLHAFDRVRYLVVFELDGQTHVGGCMGEQAKPDVVKQHFQNINPKMNILIFRRCELGEEEAIAEKLRNDPEHIPATIHDLIARETIVLEPGTPA